jgi:hypothetical protein
MDVSGSANNPGTCKYLNISDKYMEHYLELYVSACDASPHFFSEHATDHHFRSILILVIWEAVSLMEKPSPDLPAHLGHPSMVLVVSCLPTEVQSESNSLNLKFVHYHGTRHGITFVAQT